MRRHTDGHRGKALTWRRFRAPHDPPGQPMVWPRPLGTDRVAHPVASGDLNGIGNGTDALSHGGGGGAPRRPLGQQSRLALPPSTRLPACRHVGRVPSVQHHAIVSPSAPQSALVQRLSVATSVPSLPSSQSTLIGSCQHTDGFQSTGDSPQSSAAKCKAQPAPPANPARLRKCTPRPLHECCSGSRQ